MTHHFFGLAWQVSASTACDLLRHANGDTEQAYLTAMEAERHGIAIKFSSHVLRYVVRVYHRIQGELLTNSLRTQETSFQCMDPRAKNEEEKRASILHAAPDSGAGFAHAPTVSQTQVPHADCILHKF